MDDGTTTTPHEHAAFPNLQPTPHRATNQRNSYHWVKEQRTLALTRAYMLLKMPDGSVAREDWVRLMACLRPDCNADHVSGQSLGSVLYFCFGGVKNGLQCAERAGFGFPSVSERAKKYISGNLFSLVLVLVLVLVVVCVDRSVLMFLSAVAAHPYLRVWTSNAGSGRPLAITWHYVHRLEWSTI